MTRQNLLLSAEYLFDLKPLKNYELLFTTLDLFPVKGNPATTGRPLISRQSLLKSLIYKNLRGLTTLSDLVNELSDNPSLALKCGLDIPKSLPAIETFSTFLKDTTNQSFQSIRENLVLELIRLKQIKGKYLSIDSCPIKANVKENNLKTSVTNRFRKDKIPKGDPDARLGVLVTYPEPFQPKIDYFWGYKNYVVSDAFTELPIAEITKPANVHDSQVFIPLFTYVKEQLSLSPKGIVGDAAFDSQSILEFIISNLKAKPYIPKSPRCQQSGFSLSKDNRICISGLKMLYWGKFKDRGRIRLKFVCPITHSKKFAKQISVCPMIHPKFLNGRGCTSYLRTNKDISKSIDYDSEHFKKIYNLRSGLERIFSRLLSVCMQNPSVKGLNATANHITIAHIIALLIALTAVKSGHKDKIRFIKTFVKDL